ncbi:energy-coupling factor transporter transmembrane component T family protein [Acetivibrio saccincola]|uniref:Transporter n=1 Tax=Acetivibrio saccincola TaxID=1677857 RepID=A0A2S8R897_9FIRM|nr:energy-coupling factor transporter transmembrane component T [Acetivibrio saccincola]NLW26443.1 energy-coupling factor transporter transmembrane protein EcfT [Acetivibrio saccincola]PQQ66029.1 transporter [Acetivibrio saccincola]
MLKDVTLGRYYPGSSLLHRTDPRIKIILTISLMITVLFTKSYVAFGILALFIFFGIKHAGIPMSFTLRGLKPVVYIIIFTALINVFLTPGRTAFEYGFIKITFEGVDRAFKLALRILLLMAGTSLLTLTTTPIALTDGIEKLLKPLKIVGVPVNDFALIISISLKFVPVLLDETNKIIKAQASRGVDFETKNPVKKLKNYIPVMVPLFINTIKRADELSLAMEARCYRGGEGRTGLRKLKLTARDILVLLFVLAFEGMLLYVQFFKILV